MRVPFVKKHNKEKGFTILELMFVIAIFAIMSSITLFNFRGFSNRAAFDNLAQDIALHIVQAQKAAISGAVSLGTISGVPPRFGVSFTSGTSANTADTQFIYFQDLPAAPTYNGKYDTTPGCGISGSECVASTKITTGQFIDQISYVPPGSVYLPVAAGSTANIVFTRPFPDAMVTICLSSGICYPPAQNVYIELGSSVDPTAKKTIVVSGLGEVRVYNGSTTCAYSGGSGC